MFEYVVENGVQLNLQSMVFWSVSDFSFRNLLHATKVAPLFRYELLVLSWLVGVIPFRFVCVAFTSSCLHLCRVEERKVLSK